MPNVILKSLLGTNRLPDLLLGVISYYNSKNVTINQFSEAVSNYLSGAEWDNTINTKSILLSGSRTSSSVLECLATNGQNIKSAIDEYLSSDALTTDQVLVQVSDAINGTTIQLSLNSVLDRLVDVRTVNGSFIATLEGVVDSIRSDAADTIEVVEQHLKAVGLENTNVGKSLLERLNGIRLSNNGMSGSQVFSCVEQILYCFGITNQNDQIIDAPISEYTGVNALTAIASDMFSTISDVVDRFPTVIVNIIGTIVYSLVAACKTVFNAVGSFIAKQLNELLGYTDAIRPLSNSGDGFLVTNYSYHIPSSLGSWQLQYIDNAFQTTGADVLSGIIPTGQLIITKEPYGGGYRVTLIPKVLNYGFAAGVIFKYFGLQPSDYLHWSFKTNDVLKHNFTGAKTLAFSCSEIDCAEFLRDLFHDDQIYVIDDLATDAGTVMGIMMSQFLTHVLIRLYEQVIVTGTWIPTNTLAQIFSQAATSSIDGAINLNGDWSDISVTNMVAALTAYSLQPNNSGFSCSFLGTDNRLTNVQEVDTNDDAGFVDVTAILCHTVWGGSSVSSGLGVFLPYTTTAISPKYSYYIPTDQDNVASTKALIKKGAITLAAIAVIVTAFIVIGKMRRKSFEYSAFAGEYSWSAAKTGDTTMMARAYSYQKRAMLLAKFAGAATSVAGSSIALSPTNSTIDSINQKCTNINTKVGDTYSKCIDIKDVVDDISTNTSNVIKLISGE